MRDDAPSHARLLRAFALAPLAAPVAFASGLIAYGTMRAMLGRDSLPTLGALGQLVIAVSLLGVPLAYGAMLVAGAPAYFVLRRAGRVSRAALWLVGAAIGVVVALLLAPSLRGEMFSIPFPWWVGGLLGMVSAESFWRLLGRPTTT